MKSQTIKTILKIIAYDLIFLVILRLALVFIQHRENEVIYYINTNFHFLIAVVGWLNYKQSKVNKDIVLILSLWFTPYVIYAIFYNLTVGEDFSLFSYINYQILSIYLASYQLFITLYLFFKSLYPYKNNRSHYRLSISFSFFITFVIYSPMFFSGAYLIIENLFTKSYYMHLINFSLLVVFWHQYTQTRIIFSEYLSSIISVYSAIIGLAFLHAFSYENDLLFIFIGQYFNAILFLIMIVLWVMRLIYLDTPESKENEEYIENYYLLHGIIDKPRKGLLITFYSGLNRTAVIIFVVVMVFLGIYLFSYDQFKIFIKLNLLILILATVVSAILAIITWYNRWYDTMGVFFKKQNNNNNGE